MNSLHFLISYQGLKQDKTEFTLWDIHSSHWSCHMPGQVVKWEKTSVPSLKSAEPRETSKPCAYANLSHPNQQNIYNVKKGAKTFIARTSLTPGHRVQNAIKVKWLSNGKMPLLTMETQEFQHKLNSVIIYSFITIINHKLLAVKKWKEKKNEVELDTNL